MMNRRKALDDIFTTDSITIHNPDIFPGKKVYPTMYPDFPCLVERPQLITRIVKYTEDAFLWLINSIARMKSKPDLN